MVVVQRQQGVSALLDVCGDVAHQRVEVLGPLHQADGKDQFRVLGVPGFDGDLVPGEQVPGAEAELQGVAQVDRDGHGSVVARRCGRADCRLRCQRPGRPGQVRRHRVNVYAGHRVPEAVENLLRVPLRIPRRCDEMGYGFRQERPGTAGGVQHSLTQGGVHQFPDHGPGQPGGGVVFAQLSALLRRYHRLVQDDGGVRRAPFSPVEPRDAAGKGLQQAGRRR